MMIVAGGLFVVAVVFWCLAARGANRDFSKLMADLDAVVEQLGGRYDDDGKDMGRSDYARLRVPGRHGVYVDER